MNPNGDVQFNEEQRADAYNEDSLKKEIHFFFCNPRLSSLGNAVFFF